MSLFLQPKIANALYIALKLCKTSKTSLIQTQARFESQEGFLWKIDKDDKENEENMTSTTTATIDMGPGTHAVPLSMFRDNRLRVCNALKGIPNIGDDKMFILLQGGDSINLYNTDVEYLFRQVRHTHSQRSNCYYFVFIGQSDKKLHNHFTFFRRLFAFSLSLTLFPSRATCD